MKTLTLEDVRIAVAVQCPKVDFAAIDLDTRFDHRGIDSLDLIEIMMQLEETKGTGFPAEIKSCRTVGELIDIAKWDALP